MTPPDKAVECRYLFNMAEWRTAYDAYHHANRWPTRLASGFVWIVVLMIVFITIWNNRMHPLSAILLQVVPLLVVLLVFSFLGFGRLGSWINGWYFRRNPVCDQDVVYTFSENELLFQTSVLSQRNLWSTIGNAAENPKGFVLFMGKGKRSFHWVPKRGFSSSQDIDAFRSLLEKHVTSFKR